MRSSKSNHLRTKTPQTMKKPAVLNSIWHLDNQVRALLKRDVNDENQDPAHDQGLYNDLLFA